jgi:hypothetical protein
MKHRACLTLLLLLPAFHQDRSDHPLGHWNYEVDAPLNIRQASVQDRDGIRIYDISYSSPVGDRSEAVGPNGGVVTAYLVVPAGKGPFPAVIYGHWCMPGSEKKNRTEFLEEAIVSFIPGSSKTMRL